jgi:hypothetical protein
MLEAQKIAKLFVNFYFYRKSWGELSQQMDNSFVQNIIKKWDSYSSSPDDMEPWCLDLLEVEMIPQVSTALEMIYTKGAKADTKRAEESKQLFAKFARNYFEKNKLNIFDMAHDIIADSFENNMDFGIGSLYNWDE